MTKSLTQAELVARYGRSLNGSFGVIDTIGVPHTYTVGVKHVVMASDHYSGRLGEEVCRRVQCAHPGCTLKYEQHETALLVECRAPITDSSDKASPELHAYLLSVKDLAEADGYVGFAFVEAKR